jgi:hypothetical protein
MCSPSSRADPPERDNQSLTVLSRIHRNRRVNSWGVTVVRGAVTGVVPVARYAAVGLGGVTAVVLAANPATWWFAGSQLAMRLPVA